jgi:hypothetical protein
LHKKTLKNFNEKPCVELKSAELKEQMIRLRVAKKWMNDDGEDSVYRAQVETFIEICLLVGRIQDTCTEIAETGYINPLKKAYEFYIEQHNNKNEEQIYEMQETQNLQVHFWNNFDFDIYIVDENFDKTCVERFRETNKLMSKILEDVKNESLKILNSKKDYYLNYLSGP